ncbi:protein-glutamate methylesterase/protein-glutamine glutaminase [Peribacillus frigoritolerans]|uniref:protein-glutamate methylesterase/protein-glutamine glutaminase n=1 Tax=Peribacillus frigoritolerans TaxID=450367 RepID=UPI00105A8CC7|nr:chemotaxis response regulator protein-glutamate methylesterase [Peribacillus frigoritolerans]TDL83314.1 chemotaxis response regulator protein-glutamate methylesterase [Peribacillus frigoritolerans]
MTKIRVLVVDDSAFMRKLITDFLEESGFIEVVAAARNGQDALSKIGLLDPDVITLDIEMPGLNGLQLLKRIMEDFPKPVIMLSSTTKEGADHTIQSLQLGAIDFITKPSGAISLDLHKVKQELIQKVQMASHSGVKKTSSIRMEPIKINKKTCVHRYSKHLVCIGTSTGGPRALQQVLPRLPEDLEAPVFIVQHMPEGFTSSLAARLNALSAINVKEAEEGELALNGTAYIAPGGFHMKIAGDKNGMIIRLNKENPRSGHRPSVDTLFESISMLENIHKVAVIMTGMGADGTVGLKKLKQSGDLHAISESEKTSIVFGMPKNAFQTKAIDAVLDVQDIAASIMKFIRG